MEFKRHGQLLHLGGLWVGRWRHDQLGPAWRPQPSA